MKLGMPAWARDLAFLILLVSLENSYVLLTRYTRTATSAPEVYNIQDVVFMTEVGKLVVSIICEYFETQGQLSQSLREHTMWSRNGLKTVVPASLFFVQNSIYYYGLSYLPSSTFMVLYQSKVLMLAGISTFVLSRTYSMFQWGCLTALMAGMGLVISATAEDNASDSPLANVNVVAGVIAVFMTTFSSALAVVSFEKLLKGRDAGISIYMRNIQLAGLSLTFAGVHYMFQGRDDKVPFLHGFTAPVWLLLFLRSVCGILVAFIVKYMDAVVKQVASSVSVVVGCYLSAMLFETNITSQFWCGAVIVAVSCYGFLEPKTSGQVLRRLKGRKAL